ncbi:hypothetical protein DDB_G0272929 [Dictyostelium discoideum AX4]|uniref:Uncharacterized protein n=1 Tax=Dictyostelium discoideum TaxID=44689 RepID=Q86II1_DICDI|nr:hypothetical protein DDB_G0272929 [Dictyostelium discoideum AX4]EAL71102.1 hypothetical protein DDB_G0272929 [Dictyostelium discoideum AX4]|eukprot:XP_644878.1 hypothetical protein DDB_G0272929 [Dictyostelium discoideum AX4]
MADPENNNNYNVDSGSNINDKHQDPIEQKDSFSKILKEKSILIGDKTVEFAKEHPYTTTAIAITGVTTGGAIIATPYIAAALGFGTGGIIKSTIAAKTMATLGSGSKIGALLQSIGAKSTILHLVGATKIAAISGSISAACVSTIYYAKDCFSKILNYFNNNKNNNKKKEE